MKTSNLFGKLFKFLFIAIAAMFAVVIFLWLFATACRVFEYVSPTREQNITAAQAVSPIRVDRVISGDDVFIRTLDYEYGVYCVQRDGSVAYPISCIQISSEDDSATLYQPAGEMAAAERAQH